MTTKIYYLAFSLVLTSCVLKSDYDKIKAENEQLKNEVNQITNQKNELETLQKQEEEKKQKSKAHSETEALRLLRDYYDYYNGDMIYRNPRVRKVDYNTFNISLEECTKKGGFDKNDFFWSASVKILIINDDGTYKVTSKL